MEKGWLETLLHGIPAGFFVAAMVWMLPNARGSEIWVIVIATYMIALGGFAHVVVGSMEAFLLVLAGEVAIVDALWGCLLPAFIGNVLGGTVLFSLLAYGQVRQEID
jgi:formate/nitrite transporter FocA (FNT family)